MKKIMFNDKYGLTKAVLEGMKTMTRRSVNLDRVHTIIPGRIAECYLKYAPYKVGEVVAVAQSYHALNKAGFVAPEWCEHTCEDSPGYSNKMFVRADLMPYQIRITNVRVEHLQDITDEDCLNEGIKFYNCGIDFGYKADGVRGTFGTARKAFAALIDKISGEGTWKSNPRVYVYEFELVK